MIKAIVNTKGGVGKTQTAAHILPWLSFKGTKIKVIEIDNNNQSSVYTHSHIVDFISISTGEKEMRKALAEVAFDPKIDYIIDAGGGDDTLKVIDALKRLGEHVEFYIPITADAETLYNLSQTVEAIGEHPKHLILNNFKESAEADFWFIYGDEENGFAAQTYILEDFNSVIKVPYSKSLGQAKVFNKSVGDVAIEFSRQDFAKAKEEAREQGFEAFDALIRERNRGEDALNFLNSIKIEG